MSIVFAVLGFGLFVIILFFMFGIKKLQPLSEERVCICTNVMDDEDKEKEKSIKDRAVILCERFNALITDFRERRNEFMNSLGQFIVIIATITLLVVLLILDKIKSEAALPLISALGSYGIGKTVASIKNNTSPDNQHNEPSKTKEKE